jgi:recombination protein RecR
LRLVLHLIKKDVTEVNNFSNAISSLREKILFCTRCHNIADKELCNICLNTSRKNELICVVENIRDVIAIESTQQYNGLYHVLGGVISPLDGIGPDQLQIDSLVERVRKENTEEIIFALSPNIQGDTTIYYVSKRLNDRTIKITTIARGIAFGGELEYADEMTLARSISNRMPVENYVIKQ